MSLNNLLGASGKLPMKTAEEHMQVSGKLIGVLEVMMELQTRELEAEKEVIAILAGKQ
jgi:hypothetical protein